MKKMKWWMGILLATAWAGAALGAVGVTNVVVQQRYPWNGLVDIDYEVVSNDADADVYVTPIGWNGDLNRKVPMTKLSGEGASGPVKAGKHRMTWDMGEEDADFHSSAFSVKFAAVSGLHPYLVIDMNGGPNNAWTINVLDDVPEGGWTEAYKTTKLVLRLVLPGTFKMGSPEGEEGRCDDGRETQHEVVLTRPFYIGVFEVTQKQWMLAMGNNPSEFGQWWGDGQNQLPVECVTYDMIRGQNEGANWPKDNHVDAGSFLGVMRAKTGLALDLPTEAQWEYACRAGTTTAWGGNLAEMARFNEGDTSWVGSYAPNAWGLYDMHGNLLEWCLDWGGENNLGAATVIDPVGEQSGSARVIRGGCFAHDAADCRSAVRMSKPPQEGDHGIGFRLAWHAGF